MKKTPIKILILGHLGKNINLKIIKKFKSNFFEIKEEQIISHLPKCKKNDGYYDVVYSKDEINSLLTNKDFEGITFAIMKYGFKDNFYLHRVDKKIVCLSLKNIDYYLSEEQIPIENFIIKNILEICAIKEIFTDVSSDKVYDLIHLDTRGCLFDMNGEKTDIIYNTNSAVLCDSCKNYIKNQSVDKEFIKNLEKDLKKIKNPFIFTIESKIKKYPLVSLLLTIALTIILNVTSNFLWEFKVKNKIPTKNTQLLDKKTLKSPTKNVDKIKI